MGTRSVTNIMGRDSLITVQAGDIAFGQSQEKALAEALAKTGVSKPEGDEDYGNDPLLRWLGA